MKNLKVIKRITLSMFVAMFMFMPFVEGTHMSASSVMVDPAVQEEVLIAEELQSVDNPKEGRFAWAAFFAGAGLTWMWTQTTIIGGYSACKKWNDSNWAMDRYCDANGFFRD